MNEGMTKEIELRCHVHGVNMGTQHFKVLSPRLGSHEVIVSEVEAF